MSQLLGCAHVKPYRVTNYFLAPRAAELRGEPIAVLTFQNLTEMPKADWIVANEFNLQLGKTGEFVLLERMRIDELIEEQDLHPDRIDQKTAVKIGKMLGARGVILGTVTECRPHNYEKLKQEKGAPKDIKIDVEDLTFASILLYYAVTTPDTAQAEGDTAEVKEEKRHFDWKKACIVTGIGAVIVGGCALYSWIVNRPEPAKMGMNVALVDVETGEQVWQAAETFDGGDPCVRALVPKDQHKRLSTDLDYLNRVLCQELAKTIVE